MVILWWWWSELRIWDKWADRFEILTFGTWCFTYLLLIIWLGHLKTHYCYCNNNNLTQTIWLNLEVIAKLQVSLHSVACRFLAARPALGGIIYISWWIVLITSMKNLPIHWTSFIQSLNKWLDWFVYWMNNSFNLVINLFTDSSFLFHSRLFVQTHMTVIHTGTCNNQDLHRLHSFSMTDYCLYQPCQLTSSSVAVLTHALTTLRSWPKVSSVNLSTVTTQDQSQKLRASN